MPSLTQDILDACRNLSFAEAGIAAIQPTRWAGELTQWLAAGKHGQMEYLARNLEHRLDPSGLLPGARSMILVADQYATRNAATDPPLKPGAARIARYARGRDYHEVIKKRLHNLCDSLRARFPDAQFRSFTDTAPLLEREHASRAGLGWIAKNSLLINPRLGSYLFLGGILTTLDLAPSHAIAPSHSHAPTPSRPHAPTPSRLQDPFPVPDHCGTCTRCIDACPTHAITPYSVDATRCISYLTIEHRTVIDPEFHGAIGDWLYGCDICQEVCPHNSPRDPGLDVGTTNPAYAPRRDSFDLLEVLNWTEPDRREAFTSSAMKRATLAMMKRNALIAAGNNLGPADPISVTRHDPLRAIGDPSPGAAPVPRHDLSRGAAPASSPGREPRVTPPSESEPRRGGTPATADSPSNPAPSPTLRAALLQRVQHLASDESEPELVRQTARQVLDRFAAPATAPAAPPPIPAPATTPAAQ